MDVIEFFGDTVKKLAAKNTDIARGFLKFGWNAQNLKLQVLPDKRLIKSEQYLAHIMMDMMLAPLRDPSHSAIVSIFTPCELLQEVGLHAYNAEAYSSYIAGSKAESDIIQLVDAEGISETLCSYHKIFDGAATSGLLPKPKCIVHTNLMCDANLVSFRHMSKIFDVPLFYIDVPTRANETSVAYVERQLHELATFLQDITGNKIDEDSLCERVARSKRSLDAFDAAQKLKATRDVPTDLVSPMFAAITNNVMLGTKEEEKFASLYLSDVMNAPPKKAKHIYWMHTIPFWSDAIYSALAFNEHAQISGEELAQAASLDFDANGDPYGAMARRLVYNLANGSSTRRIDIGISHAKDVGADGVIWFNQWGCKRTIGVSQLAKKKFEQAGLPTLVLDGDGCDRSHGGEGQTSTRLGAFLELLDAR